MDWKDFICTYNTTIRQQEFKDFMYRVERRVHANHAQTSHVKNLTISQHANLKLKHNTRKSECHYFEVLIMTGFLELGCSDWAPAGVVIGTFMFDVACLVEAE